MDNTQITEEQVREINRRSATTPSYEDLLAQIDALQRQLEAAEHLIHRKNCDLAHVVSVNDTLRSQVQPLREAAYAAGRMAGLREAVELVRAEKAEKVADSMENSLSFDTIRYWNAPDRAGRAGGGVRDGVSV